MDSTIISVILSQLQAAFNTDFQTISWVASAYFLAQAAVLPIIGYVSDRIGTKVAFLTSLALFTAGSLLCALQHYTDMTNNSSDSRVRRQYQELEQNMYMIWRETLDRYADEIAALQAELESNRAYIGQALDAHSAHLQKLSQAISSDLRASAPTLSITPRTGQFRVIGRGTPTVTGSVGAREGLLQRGD